MKLSKSMTRLLSDLIGSQQQSIIRLPLEKTVVRKGSLEEKAARELANHGIVIIYPSGNAHFVIEKSVK